MGRSRAGKPLPARTSRYNVGNAPGRFRDRDGRLKHFALKARAPLFDGGGRRIAYITQPVLLNVGAGKRMVVESSHHTEEFLWAWNTGAGSGWVARRALLHPPRFAIDTTRNPSPPHEAATSLIVDAQRGTHALKNLRHTNSRGVIPDGGGNKGEHYGGRHPGPTDYVYLLFACPNVRRGGTARDSIVDGGEFVLGLDDRGQPIAETMTMYRDGDFTQPVSVTFLYGRAADGDIYGWMARANVGRR
jgi:hypothetical protein